MTAPDGTRDLLADVEEHVRRKEADLAKEKAHLEELRGRSVTIDEDGNEVESPGNELVTTDGNRELMWKHSEVEFAGETFNVRTPQPQALAIFQIVASRFIKEQTKVDVIGLFLQNHMSPMSFLRFAQRSMDPDDPDVTKDSMMEMLKVIARSGTSRPTGPSRG
jgi:hypothetical protein